MSLNLVTVTVAVQGGPSDATPPEGNFVFSPNGTMWPLTAGALPIDPAIQTGTLTLGTASVQLVASDNFATGVLYWDVIINVRGLPTVNFPALPIIFATGASQSIWDILQLNGWIPTSQV
jgi:hypothetical protein